MTITTKAELALCDLDGTRKYLDEISYNIRGIFRGDGQQVGDLNYKPVDIAEDLIAALDIFTYVVEKLTDLQVVEKDLPKINSIISSLRYIIENIKATGTKLRDGISEEYFLLLQDKIEILTEVVDDAERIFFELRNNKDFVEVVNKLFRL